MCMCECVENYHRCKYWLYFTFFKYINLFYIYIPISFSNL